ncbi:MAG: peptidoglycan-binding protein [Lachnospiraceae bacterium]|nr:peptidoglycan-binding protein [Lachnospiraceae bacterium]
MSLRQKVIDLANSQDTNEGGRKYWSWWGYESRVPWCQIFVSWIMEQAGVPASVYGKYENCQYAIEQMMEKGVWHTNGYRPQPGDICYYDWDSDGISDHVGIVASVNGDLVTVREGNKSDAVGSRISAYNSPQIAGYASPDYGEAGTGNPSAGTGNQESQTGGDRYMFSVATVQKGSVGNDVRLLQELLDYHGYGLAADGDFGTLTKSAVESYQKQHGLGADGIAGPMTWKSILLR